MEENAISCQANFVTPPKFFYISEMFVESKIFKNSLNVFHKACHFSIQNVAFTGIFDDFWLFYSETTKWTFVKLSVVLKSQSKD
eukprot:TRINITY_DN5973_c0_g1_i1.p1 TRINITY_DN5973_c0_g1~~TRINITY_DN5973_c0_g1_i1.p1  ORF type:complete len:84 (-),score=7.37 TRINITY_DN5973_c0_g1_i1:460-711(-)